MFSKFLLLSLFIASANAACPNKCSGHGVCKLGDTCHCQPRWISADCSLRECPYGLSWVTSANTDEDPSGTGGVVLSGKTSAAGTATAITLDTRHEAAADATAHLYNGMTISFLATGYSAVITAYADTRVATVAALPSAPGANAEYIITNDANNADNGRHSYTECSSKGTCDRGTGECQCFPGYEGRGCRRQACPNDCSGHGRCLYNHQVNPNYTPHAGAEVNEFASQYWDYKKARQCSCDRGYEGYDCSSRICPKGDDPLTDCGMSGGEVSDIQELVFADLSVAGYFTLTFTDMFNGNYTTKPIAIDATTANAGVGNAVAAKIEEALEELPNFAVPNVTVSHLTTVANKANYAVTFLDEANAGRQNLLVCSDAAKAAPSPTPITYDNPNVQPRFAQGQMATAAPQVLCTASSQSDTIYTMNGEGGGRWLPCSGTSGDKCNANAQLLNQYQYREHVECSNRGICDSGSGTCQCYEGFTGEACATQTVFF